MTKGRANMVGAVGIEREGLNTEQIDDRIITNDVLTKLELRMPPIASMYLFHLSTSFDPEAVARKYRVSPQRIREALGQARETALKLLKEDRAFVECVRELGYPV